VVEIFCIHARKWKNGTVETIPGMEGGGIKKNNGGGEFNYGIL
jgi:hypothetical protein